MSVVEGSGPGPARRWPGLRIERVAVGDPDAVRLIEEVQQEYVARYGSMDETPLDPLMFAPPLGSFYVGYVGNEPVVSGAWRRRDDVEAFGTTKAAEIKRMYVASGHRGLGLARSMLAHLEVTALEAGAEVVVLETGMRQPEAIALYESSGYTPIPLFGFYRDSPLCRCLAKALVLPSR